MPSTRDPRGRLALVPVGGARVLLRRTGLRGHRDAVSRTIGAPTASATTCMFSRDQYMAAHPEQPLAVGRRERAVGTRCRGDEASSVSQMTMLMRRRAIGMTSIGRVRDLADRAALARCTYPLDVAPGRERHSRRSPNTQRGDRRSAACRASTPSQASTPKSGRAAAATSHDEPVAQHRGFQPHGDSTRGGHLGDATRGPVRGLEPDWVAVDLLAEDGGFEPCWDGCCACTPGGGWGIRTPEGLHPTRFPSVRHRPLGESSWDPVGPTSILLDPCRRLSAHWETTTTLRLEASGPFDLGEVAMMGFGHRNERIVRRRDAHGVPARRRLRATRWRDRPPGWPDSRGHCRNRARPLSRDELDAVGRQVARVTPSTTTARRSTSCAWPTPCSPRCTSGRPGSVRPTSTRRTRRSVWSVLSFRRARAQGITLRSRLAEQHWHGLRPRRCSHRGRAAAQQAARGTGVAGLVGRPHTATARDRARRAGWAPQRRAAACPRPRRCEG